MNKHFGDTELGIGIAIAFIIFALFSPIIAIIFFDY
jgi:hypothetical protein